MATNFPTSLDSLTNPSSTDSMATVSHSAQHANINDAVEALEAKVGVDSSAVTTSLDYKVAQLEANAVTDHGGLTGLADDDHTQYLLADGTRAATELTVSGDMTVDTNTLHVDSTNNRVGIGTTSPSTKADIYTDASAGVPYPLTLSAKNSSGTKKDYVQIGYGIEQGAASIESGGLRVATLQSGLLTNALTFTGHASAQEWNIYTQGNSRLKIDSAGRVTLPYQPAFAVYRANGGNVSYSGNNSVDFDTKHFDVGNNFNLTTNVFTAPVSGRYFFSWSCYSNTAPTTAGKRTSIDVNGSSVEQIGQYASGVGITALVDLSANDTVGVGSVSTSFSVDFYAANGHNRFSGWLVS